MKVFTSLGNVLRFLLPWEVNLKVFVATYQIKTVEELSLQTFLYKGLLLGFC